ncbi:MAG: ABC transporter permease [Clostridiales bacterium]|nr:ABC transporter permease [Clostridiales bacterium]
MIKAYCKRVLLFLPYLACYFLALGIAMLTLVVYASEFLFEDNTDSIVSVACYMPDDDAYNRLGLGLITRMESVKHTVDINMVKSKKQVLSQVESGDAIAGIIIPEGFIEKMGTDEAVQAEVIYRDADTYEEHIVNDLIYTMSDLLGTTQCSILTAGELAEELGEDSYGAYLVEYDVQDNLLNYVLDRKDRFREVSVDDLVAKYGVRDQLTASYTLFILMMSIFVISFFFKGNNTHFRARARLSGIKTWKIFLLEAGCAAFMMYLLYVLLFIVFAVVFHTVNPLSLITIIPAILILAMLGTTLCYIVKSPAAVSYITFGAGTSLMYLAGGLIPLDYMPKFFQSAAVFNPVYYLNLFFMRSMFL